MEELEKLALEVSDQIKQVRGMEDVGTFHVVGQPNLNITIDREKSARYGLNTGDVNSVIQAAMGGAVATTLLEGDRSWNVTVRLAPKYRDNIEAVGDVKVGYQNAAGAVSYIPLRELATISLDTGASYIYHEAMQRFIPVKFSVRGRDLGSTVAEAQERIAKNVILPTGYRLVWAGEYLEWQQAKHRLEIVVPLSLVWIMVLLLGLFNSLRDSLLALAGIPFAMGGGVIALFVSGQPLSVSLIVGFISLFGVSVMNGILIITYYNQTKYATGLRRSRGHGPRRRAADAAAADDVTGGLHRPAALGTLDRHRQPGATASGVRGGGRYVDRAGSTAVDRTRPADHVPARSWRRTARRRVHAVRRSSMKPTTRRAFFNIALIAGLFVLGGFSGLGVRTWIGGLNVQRAQLERCILASKHSHASEDARSTLAHLDVEVPTCMNSAGYEEALDNKSCAPAFWQGDVFCYLPKSRLGKLIHRIDAASDRNKVEDRSNSELQVRQPT